MPALERLRGLRVVAEPRALDGAAWEGGGDPVTVLRFAPDEAFGIGATAVQVSDEQAIVVEEPGFVGARCPLADVLDRIEWPIPAGPGFSQGAIAGVPAKALVEADGATAFLVTFAAYADELEERLGWHR